MVHKIFSIISFGIPIPLSSNLSMMKFLLHFTVMTILGCLVFSVAAFELSKIFINTCLNLFSSIFNSLIFLG